MGYVSNFRYGSGLSSKVICVKPGGILSLQKHFKRSEHWVVVAGTPTLTIGEEVKDYNYGDNVFIPVEEVHRMENRTSQWVKIIEVQIGSYLGEDDIVRLDDVYGRDSK